MIKENKINFDALIVDDHPMIVEGYLSSLENYGKKRNIPFSIKTAFTLSQANFMLAKNIKLFLLDLQLPADEENNIYNGEDLAIKIRKKVSDSKIIIITMFDNVMRINDIISQINPEGIIQKSDMTPQIFETAMDKVLAGDKYYSKTIKEKVNSLINNKYNLTEVDKKILYHLAHNVKTKDLPEILLLSLRTIERKKNKLSELFGGNGSDDILLKEKAKELGIV